MNMTEIITVVITLLTLGLTLFCYLHVNRREREKTARWMKRQQSLETEIGKLRSSIAELNGRFSLRDMQSSNPSPPRGFANSINVNRRAEAMRMFRRGESPEKVAQLLSCPRQEAILLLKVYRAITAPKPAQKSNQSLPEPSPETRTMQPARAVFPPISQEEANNAATIV